VKIRLVKVTIGDAYRDLIVGAAVVPTNYWSAIVPELEVTKAIEAGLKAVTNKTQLSIVCHVVGEIDDEYIAPEYRKQ
jgi:hypothetical protein